MNMRFPSKFRSSLLALVALLACGALAAVGSAQAASGADYQVINVANGGTITATVTVSSMPDWNGEVAVSADHDICGERTSDPSAAVSAELQLQGAFVYLEDITAGKAFTPGAANLDNKGCAYLPYVQGAAAGGEFEVVNSDEALHNVHVNMGVRTLWNLALPLQGFSVVKTLPERPGMLEIRCDVHEWMKATVHLMEHPYFATTAADGTIQIGDVPAGTYTMVIWHERLGETRQQVTVAAGGTVDVPVVLDAE